MNAERRSIPPIHITNEAGERFGICFNRVTKIAIAVIAALAASGVAGVTSLIWTTSHEVSQLQALPKKVDDLKQDVQSSLRETRQIADQNRADVSELRGELRAHERLVEERR